MTIEQDIRDLRDDLRDLKARVRGHELVLTTTLAQLLKTATTTGSPIDIDGIVAEMADNVERGARAIDRSDPMGAASIRALGDEALRLLRPATSARGHQAEESDLPVPASGRRAEVTAVRSSWARGPFPATTAAPSPGKA
jgi:hypothetical protein